MPFAVPVGTRRPRDGKTKCTIMAEQHYAEVVPEYDERVVFVLVAAPLRKVWSGALDGAMISD
jgi:hypothetical protein